MISIWLFSYLFVGSLSALNVNKDLLLEYGTRPSEKDVPEAFYLPMSSQDILESVKQQMKSRYMTKMILALGSDILKANHGVPNNETRPTVASPLNITTDPCPEIYTKCSSEIFFSACQPPKGSEYDLWTQRLNLYFDLPHDLLERDKLLNATLRIYKNSSLPLDSTSKVTFELHVYKTSLTRAFVREPFSLYESKEISNDFIGWISFNLTDFFTDITNMTDNRGFLIKVKDGYGYYWNDPSLIIPMNCSDKKNTMIALPFGVVTNEPEQMFPSLTIHTGRVNKPFYINVDDHDYLGGGRIVDGMDSYPVFFQEREPESERDEMQVVHSIKTTSPAPPILMYEGDEFPTSFPPQLLHKKQMSGDDPNPHETGVRKLIKQRDDEGKEVLLKSRHKHNRGEKNPYSESMLSAAVTKKRLNRQRHYSNMFFQSTKNQVYGSPLSPHPKSRPAFGTKGTQSQKTILHVSGNSSASGGDSSNETWVAPSPPGDADATAYYYLEERKSGKRGGMGHQGAPRPSKMGDRLSPRNAQFSFPDAKIKHLKNKRNKNKKNNYPKSILIDV